jgi:hypothetical protein
MGQNVDYARSVLHQALFGRGFDSPRLHQGFRLSLQSPDVSRGKETVVEGVRETGRPWGPG